MTVSLFVLLLLFSHSIASDSLRPHGPAHQASLSIIISQSLPKLTSTESVMPSNHLILCHPLLLLPSIFPRIRVLSNESVLHIRWPKYWSFSFSISPSNEYSVLISFLLWLLGKLDPGLQLTPARAQVSPFRISSLSLAFI